ncbi:hypothetical protein Lbir_1168 [Legionella birminghamensis]|uniref:Uncharacterized protein n=1 Tax=Legionella birminghamensis TaxID=28083 RepID=A0A378I703_9GAMM|nr:hypothetical protein [Legionella birminghamensis]KTC72393.1 hypothetical protein Lbir_1168 [Legionella birminghamensis]STX30525.1 Uncharacterised protein [Legionella birminghamensis]
MFTERCESILKVIVDQVQEAKTPEEKRKIILRPFSKAPIFEADETGFQGLLDSLLENDGVKAPDEYSKTHALNLAISLGDVDACSLFLAHLDTNDINSESMLVFGYRQQYTLMHQALDPLALRVHPDKYINYTNELSENDKIALGENMALIIQQLIEKNAELNNRDPSKGRSGLYTNPPMAAGQPRCWGTLPVETLSTLRTQLILAGADPFLAGSCFQINHNFQYPINTILDGIFETINQLPTTERRALSSKFHENTKAEMVKRYSQDLGFSAPEPKPVPAAPKSGATMFR